MLKRLITGLIVIAALTAPAAGAGTPRTVLSGMEGTTIELDLGQEICRVRAGCHASRELFAGDAFREESYTMNEPRSPVKEGAASFLLPGLGQMRMGRTIRSKIYFGLEGAAWIAIGSFLYQGYSRENAYKDYAVAYAGVSGSDCADEYYEKVGSYLSNNGPGGYNEAVRREARDLYYPDAAAMNAYYDSNRIVGEQSWRWRSESAYRRFNSLRYGSDDAYRRALYAGMFALALRVVSTADAVLLSRDENRTLEQRHGKVSLKIGHGAGGVSLMLKKAF